MPTTFTTGTINQATAGAVGQSMVERIRDDLIAQGAWALVEEYYPASGIYRYYILKCKAASSGLASDFYLVLARRLSDGAIYAAICEDYNTGTHAMQFYTPNGYSSSGQVYDAQGRMTYSFVLPATAFTFSAQTPHMWYWIPGGTSTKWWLCVYDDGFAVAFNGTANGWFYGGVYTSLSSQPNDVPIFLSGSQGSSLNAQGGLTRNPAAAGITYYPAGLFATPDVVLGVAGDWRYNDKLQANQRSVAEVGLRVYQYNTGDQAVYGSFIGKLRHMRTGGGQLPSGMSFGDAYVLQNRLWVPPAPTDARVWDTGVASS